MNFLIDLLFPDSKTLSKLAAALYETTSNCKQRSILIVDVDSEPLNIEWGVLVVARKFNCFVFNNVDLNVVMMFASIVC